jgi:hypothetical protein
MHVDIRNHYCHEQAAMGHIAIQYISTEEQAADSLTKPLGPQRWKAVLGQFRLSGRSTTSAASEGFVLKIRSRCRRGMRKTRISHFLVIIVNTFPTFGNPPLIARVYMCSMEASLYKRIETKNEQHLKPEHNLISLTHLKPKPKRNLISVTGVIGKTSRR